MRYAVHVSDDAFAAIRAAARFIALDQQAPLNAQRWLFRLWQLIDDLETTPRRCPIDPIQTAATGRPTHKLNFGDYLLFYHVDDVQQRVDVVTFMHGATRSGR